MGYSNDDIKIDKTLDLTKLKPYGDTMNDGKMQLSFTLPINNDEKGDEAAIQLAKKMGMANPMVAHSEALDAEFTFFVVYGSTTHSVDYTTIVVDTVDTDVMDKYQIEDFIKTNIGRDVIFVGASTGSDAHTVGIDAIMNMKGFAGHYGLERYKGVEAINMGSQVPNEEFIKKALEVNADVLLVSQTVTQKDVHIDNLTNLIEILDAEGLRDRFILVAGGARMTNELAKELGYDAGFGAKKYAEDVAGFAVQKLVEKMN